MIYVFVVLGLFWFIYIYDYKGCRKDKLLWYNIMMIIFVVIAGFRYRLGIELRIVDRWFPSSKTCHCCKNIKKDLKLSDRIFRCDCGYIEDRDFNAALNLRDATTYEVA